jgi:L-malate glycosyltransferase
MRTLHQVLVTAVPRDAITNSVLEIQKVLREVASSEVYAKNVHPDLDGLVLPLEAHPTHGKPAVVGSDEVTIVHPSMGDPVWLDWVLGLNGKFILSYHNMTPASFFRAWDSRTATYLDFGRKTIGVFADRTILAFADSAFNAAELSPLGFENVAVGALLFDTQGLARTQPRVEPLRRAARSCGPRILHVGQLYPHKRGDFLIAAFKILVEAWRPDATLVVTGAGRLEKYRRHLDEYVKVLGLDERVSFAGSIDDEELAAYFRSSDLLVTASEHEGFCVPLIEAMSMGLPVVARDFGAVVETVAGAGLVIPADGGPAMLAAAMAEVLDDPLRADEMRDRGYERAKHFSLDRMTRRFLELLVPALETANTR